MKQLLNKRCLIIGGTSGIGLAAAERFLAEDARLVVAGLDRPGDVADTELAELGEIHFEVADVTDVQQVNTLFQSAASLLGGLDVVYHVAGSSGRKHGDGPLHDCTDAGWQTTLDANLTSVFLTNRAAVRYFLAAKQAGVILNLSSVLAMSPSPEFFDTAAYTAAKGAIISLSRLAAARYAKDGIRVNVIAPGLIDTPMSARAIRDPAIRAYLATKQPLAVGPGRSEDCAGAAVFPCSDAARLVTGTVLTVDAGWCVSDGQIG